MFTFNASIPANVQRYLVPFLQAWIDRADHPLLGLEETMHSGLVTFRRDPWPVTGPTVVSPAGDVDLATCQAFSLTI